jgi:hypothetical protein
MVLSTPLLSPGASHNIHIRVYTSYTVVLARAQGDRVLTTKSHTCEFLDSFEGEFLLATRRTTGKDLV